MLKICTIPGLIPIAATQYSGLRGSVGQMHTETRETKLSRLNFSRKNHKRPKSHVKQFDNIPSNL